MQEFVLAQRIKLCVGNYAINYEEFAELGLFIARFYQHLLDIKGADLFGTEPNSQELGIRSSDMRRFLQDCRTQHHKNKAISIVEYLRGSLQLDTTYPRDRLYGGYGIIDRTVVERLPLDLDLSVESLSLILSTQLLEDEHEKFLLEHCAGINRTPQSDNIFRTLPEPSTLPSWCVDLDKKALDAKRSAMGLSRHYRVYATGGAESLVMRMTPDPRVIGVDAYIIESIQSVTSPFEGRPTFSEEPNDSSTRVDADWTEKTLIWLGHVFDISDGPGDAWYEVTNKYEWETPLGMLGRTIISDLDLPTQHKHNIDITKRAGPDIFEQFRVSLKVQFRAQQRYRFGKVPKTMSIKYGQDDLRLYMNWLLSVRKTDGKRVGATYTRRLALLPGDAAAGDKICIIKGVRVPFVIRPRSGDGLYELVGSCYLHEMMDGQALEVENFRWDRILIG
jgi:hypothetical protein